MHIVKNSSELCQDLGINERESQEGSIIAQDIVNILESGITKINFTDYDSAVNDLEYGDRSDNLARENEQDAEYKEQLQAILKRLYIDFLQSSVKDGDIVVYSTEMIQQTYRLFTEKEVNNNLFYNLKRQDSLEIDDMYEALKNLFKNDLKEMMIQNMKNQIRVVK